MKKLFTLFAAALLGFCAYAQDTTEPCPTVPEFYLLNGEDAANVEIEFGFSQNNSANLNGFNFAIQKPEGATWKRAQGLNYFTGKGYAPYILGMLNQNMGTEFTDEELEDMLSDLCDVKSNVRVNPDDATDPSQVLVIIQILSTLDCRFYPATPGKVGKFKLDMSALEDGEYDLHCNATPQGGSFSFTGGPEGSRAWTIDEELAITLVKTGNVVTVKGDTPVVEPITIAGTVVDKDNAPLEGVTVTLDEATGAKEAITTTTAADGTYSLEYTPEEGKEYNVTFAKDNYQTATYPAEEVPETVVLEVVTGISTIGVDGNDGRIYDLQGRELKSVPEHGIYIQNGKKHVK